LTVADEKASLPATTITDDDDLLGVGRRLGHMSAGGFASRGGAHGGADGSFTGPVSLLPAAGALAVVVGFLVQGLRGVVGGLVVVGRRRSHG